ncbi:MAG: protease modulator HflC [Halanaerobiales bacterium]|nr:protease modulator HflC [Halanaerobiales bacterium]
MSDPVDITPQKSSGFKVSSSLIISGIVAILILIVLSSSIYTIREDEVAVVRSLGKITKIIVGRDNHHAEEQNQLMEQFKNVNIVKRKGLFFKVPIITSVEKVTSKLLTYTSNAEKINTREKKQFIMSMYAQYEITHPGLFQISMGTKSKANAILDDLVYPVVIKRINRIYSETFLTDKEALYNTLHEGLIELNQKVKEYGIVIKDIEIFRTLLPPANIKSTFNKMSAERQAIAKKIRSEGKEQYDMTVALVDKEEAQLIAEAIETAEKVRGEADAEALQIYADGYSVDPEFYEFMRSLDALKNGVDENTKIYIDRNNPVLKYFSNE